MKASSRSGGFHDIKGFTIIDGHCHIGSYYRTHTPYCDADEMVEGMDHVGVSKVCISSFWGIQNDSHSGNTIVAEAIQKYPDRFVGMASINPNRKDTIESELVRCFEELNMSMIKLHPDWSKCPVFHDNYTPVYQYAEANKLAILSHSWHDGETLDKLSNQYPKIRFIQAHTGGLWGGKGKNPILEVVKNNVNVYTDIVSSIAYYGAFEKLVDYVGPDKIIYGSDYPMMSLEYQLGRVLFSDISKAEKQKILEANILHVIDGEKI